MEFSPIPTEQTSAATDVLLVFLAAYSIYRLKLGSPGPAFRQGVWIAFFLCIGVASLAGAVAHGFTLSPVGERVARMPVNVFIGLAVSSVGAGAVYDFVGERAASRIVPSFLGLGAGVPLVTILFPGWRVVSAGPERTDGSCATGPMNEKLSFSIVFHVCRKRNG